MLFEVPSHRGGVCSHEGKEKRENQKFLQRFMKHHSIAVIVVCWCLSTKDVMHFTAVLPEVDVKYVMEVGKLDSLVWP